MELGLGGLRVLVTAGAAGVGCGIVDAFIEEGARVFACDVDEAALASLPPSVGRRPADVADRGQVTAYSRRQWRSWGCRPSPCRQARRNAARWLWRGILIRIRNK